MLILSSLSPAGVVFGSSAKRIKSSERPKRPSTATALQPAHRGRARRYRRFLGQDTLCGYTPSFTPGTTPTWFNLPPPF
jgi:hypothetical protein